MSDPSSTEPSKPEKVREVRLDDIPEGDIEVTRDAGPQWERHWYDPADGLDLTIEEDQRAALRRLLEAVRRIDADLSPGSLPWVWRGQGRKSWHLIPSMFGRATPGDRIAATESLLDAARATSISTHEGSVLPPLALLARLQHQGAATPLLDISTDPFVALYMAVVDAPNAPEPDDALLFAIRQPRQSIRAYDTRPIGEILEAVNRADPDQAFLYIPPPVDQRLRIQRGRFLLCPTTTEALTHVMKVSSRSDIQEVVDGTAPDQKALRNVCVIRIPAEIKRATAEWLALHAGLTVEDIYPTAFDHPHLEAFAKDHNRSAPYPPEPR
jgi:FRG domain